MIQLFNNLALTAHSNRKAFFALAVAFQFAVLVFMIFFYQSVIIGGTEVVLKTVPVDPRDVLRGQYVALRYDISTIDYSLFTKGDLPHPGDIVYVSLLSAGQYWRPIAASKEPPVSNVFLRGEVVDSVGGRIAVIYGIESYFVDPETAEELEAAARRGNLLMRVTVGEDGKGIVRGVANDKQYANEPSVFFRGGNEYRPRDARRISDIKQLQLALELYYDANNEYPDALIKLAPTYIPSVPLDPERRETYSYARCGGNTYHLGADLSDLSNVALQSDIDGVKLCSEDAVNGTDETSCTGQAASERYCFDVAEGPLAAVFRGQPLVVPPPSRSGVGSTAYTPPQQPVSPSPISGASCQYGLRSGGCNTDSRQYIHAAKPNGGEALCSSHDTVIEWESAGLNAVQVLVRPFGSITTPYVIGSYPATFNEEAAVGKGVVSWSVNNIPEGFGYELVINSVMNGVIFSDTSDGVFSIIRCEG